MHSGALLFTRILVIDVAVLLPTMDVASSPSIMFLFLFFLVNISVIRIRINMGDELSYGFLMPFFPWIPLLAIVCQAVLAVWLVHMSLIAWVIAPIWVISSILVFHFYSKKRALPTREEVQVIEEERAPEGDEYRIMVAVANPNNAIPMVRSTYYISEAKKGRINLLHMVPVPEQVPLSDAKDLILEGKEAIIEVMLHLILKFPITTTIRYCRNIARGILSAVKEKKIEMLIMGWEGKSSRHAFSLGSTLDYVIERAPCNVVILKDLGDKKFKSILVPVGGGPNSCFALEIASILAEKHGARITAFIVNDEKRKIDIQKAALARKNGGHIAFDLIDVKRRQASSVSDAILEESERYDLVVLGATQDPLIRQLTRDSITYKVATCCEKPRVIVKASAGFKSWIRRWL